KWMRRRPAITALGAGLAIALLLGSVAVLWQWRQTLAEHQRAEVAARDLRQNLYVSEMAVAFQAFGAGNADQTRRLLENLQKGQKELRGFEWRYLWQASRPQELFWFPPEGYEIWGLGISRDGRLLASGTSSPDCPVRLWDFNRRENLQALRGPAG